MNGSFGEGLNRLGARGRTSSGIFQFPAKDCQAVITAKEVSQLRDFSAELPNLGEARRSYLRWRRGGSKGMEGNVDSKEAMAAMIQKLVQTQSGGTPSGGTPVLRAMQDPQLPSPTNL